MKTAAIILAAGFSSRMGTDKALLPFGDTTALELVVASYATAGVERIMVVTGQNHDALVQLCLPVDLVRNPVPTEGMLSSIKLGAAQLGPELDAFFVHPVDTPLVSSETLRNLVVTLQQQHTAAVIPCYDGKRGHPPLLRRRQLAGAILAYTGTGGLRGLLSCYPVATLPVDDQGVLLGMNTPQQYAELQRYLRTIL